MGWDCSYHLVDPRLVENLAKHLRADAPVSPLLADYDAKLWNQLLSSVLTAPPDEAAQAACILAVLACSAHWPHISARNVAFSFGGADMIHGQGPELPCPNHDSPEVLFGSLVSGRPDLRGHFPRVFSAQSGTGVYISPLKVSSAARIVERAIESDGADSFIPLHESLEAAARCGVAWWEATDLDVRQAHEELLEPPAEVPNAEYGPRDIVVLPGRGAFEVVGVRLETMGPRDRSYYTLRSLAGGDVLRVLAKPDPGRPKLRKPVKKKKALEALAALELSERTLPALDPGVTGRARLALNAKRLKAQHKLLQSRSLVDVARLVRDLRRDAKVKPLDLGGQSALSCAEELLVHELAIALGEPVATVMSRLDPNSDASK